MTNLQLWYEVKLYEIMLKFWNIKQKWIAISRNKVVKTVKRKATIWNHK